MTVIKFIKLFTVLSLCISSISAVGQKSEHFNLVLCKQTIADSAIEKIMIIDSLSRDTIQASNLLQKDTIRLKYGSSYFVLFVGKRDWDYLAKLKNYEHDWGTGIEICIDCNAIHTKTKRYYDFTSTFNGCVRFSSLSNKIYKGKSKPPNLCCLNPWNKVNASDMTIKKSKRKKQKM